MAIKMKPDSFSVSFFDEVSAMRNMRKDALHVVGYARLSYDEDGANFCSIVNQEEILSAYYHSRLENTLSTFEFIADDNVSGYKFERNGLYKLLHMIEDGKCNIIIAKDLSRIGRHGALVQLFIEQCERIGIRIIAMEDYDSEKQSDEFVLGIKTWSNERLVKDTSIKIKKIIDHKQKNGTWICAVPFGYICNDFQDVKIEVDREAAATVNRIDHMYLVEQKGCKTIAKELTIQKVPTPSQHRNKSAIENGKRNSSKTSSVWSAGQIYKILSDDFYIGTLRTGKYTRRGINGIDRRTDASEQNVFENHHEAIRTKETHELIQAQMNSRRRDNFRATKDTVNIYRGIVRCGDCGSPMFVINDKRLKQHYSCGRYMKLGKTFCTKHTVKTEVLNKMAIALITSIRNNYAELIRSIDKELEYIKKSEKSSAQIINDLEKQKDALLAEQEVIEIQRIKQIASHPERENSINALYDKMYNNNSEELNAVEAQINEIKNADKTIAGAAKELKGALAIIDNIIESGEITRSDAELLFDQILVYEDGRIEVKLKPAIQASDIPPIELIDAPQKQKPRNFLTKIINEVSSGSPLETSFIVIRRRIDTIITLAKQLKTSHKK